MALDIGERRVGVAISDTLETIASAIKVIGYDSLVNKDRDFLNLIEKWEPDAFLIGLPRNMDGSCGGQANKIKEIANNLQESLNIDIEFYDERLSSKEAKLYMHEMGLSEKEMRGKIDMVAAQIFLQSFLDSKRN